MWGRQRAGAGARGPPGPARQALTKASVPGLAVVEQINCQRGLLRAEQGQAGGQGAEGLPERVCSVARGAAAAVAGSSQTWRREASWGSAWTATRELQRKRPSDVSCRAPLGPFGSGPHARPGSCRATQQSQHRESPEAAGPIGGGGGVHGGSRTCGGPGACGKASARRAARERAGVGQMLGDQGGAVGRNLCRERFIMVSA